MPASNQSLYAISAYRDAQKVFGISANGVAHGYGFSSLVTLTVFVCIQRSLTYVFMTAAMVAHLSGKYSHGMSYLGYG